MSVLGGFLAFVGPGDRGSDTNSRRKGHGFPSPRCSLAMTDAMQTRSCPFCDHRNLLVANYCARCGRQLRLLEEKGLDARSVLADVKQFLKKLQKRGREWEYGGWPPGAEKTMVARIEECCKQLGAVRDDEQCPRPEREVSKVLLNRCEFARYAVERKYGADWSNYDGFPGDRSPRAWLKRGRTWW